MPAPNAATLAALGITPAVYATLAPAAQRAMDAAARRVKAPKPLVGTKAWDAPDGKTLTLAVLTAGGKSITLGRGKLNTALDAVDAAGGDTTGIRVLLAEAFPADSPAESEDGD